MKECSTINDTGPFSGLLRPQRWASCLRKSSPLFSLTLEKENAPHRDLWPWPLSTPLHSCSERFSSPLPRRGPREGQAAPGHHTGRSRCRRFAVFIQRQGPCLPPQPALENLHLLGDGSLGASENGLASWKTGGKEEPRAGLRGAPAPAWASREQRGLGTGSAQLLGSLGLLVFTCLFF